MDDKIKIQIKGQKLSLDPVTDGQMEALGLAGADRDPSRSVDVLLRVLRKSMGDDQYNRVTDRLIGETSDGPAIRLEDLTALFERLVSKSKGQDEPA